MGVAALVQLVMSLGATLDAPTWLEAVDVFAQSAEATAPNLADLASTLARQSQVRASSCWQAHAAWSVVMSMLPTAVRPTKGGLLFC